MEAWRQWPLGRRMKNGAQQHETEIPLTPAGLLMEGDFTSNRLLFAFLLELAQTRAD